MKFLTENILLALNEAKKEFRTNKRIAEETGISEVHIARLLAGKVQILKEDTYRRLKPLLKKHLVLNKDGENGKIPLTFAESRSEHCPAGLNELERLLLKYFRQLPEDKRIEYVHGMKGDIKN